MAQIKFKTLLNAHEGKNFLIYCPGKNIAEWHDKVMKFIKKTDAITIGCNKISQFLVPDYHIFTNNDKYQHYGNSVHKSSQLMIGRYVKDKWIKRHKPEKYILVNYTDRDQNEPISYDAKHDVVKGYYRTSGNLAIVLAHQMGAGMIFVAGMSGFLFNFDGDVHYYKGELKRSDFKTKEEWHKKYDKPISRCLRKLAGLGINFKIITPTIYTEHLDSSLLR